MRLRVLEVYGHATLQDGGRPGWRHRGVPPGGAFDRESLALANAMVGNPGDAPGLELGLGALVLDAPDGAVFAVVGAESRVIVDGRRRESPGRFRVRPGAHIEVGVGVVGARLYLALPGGIAGREELGSVSSHLIGARAELVAKVPCHLEDARLAELPDTLGATTFRVLSGPRRVLVPELDLGAEWRLRAQSDRVGLRLSGPAPPHGIELASEPMCVGAVQATPSGGLLIFGPDGPTIGGYPHVATVIRADIGKVGQLRPGQSVRFQEVDLPDARNLSQRNDRALERKVAQLTVRLDGPSPGN